MVIRGGSPPVHTPSPQVPQGHAHPLVPVYAGRAPEPGSDTGSLGRSSGRSSASSTVINPPFPILPTPPRPGGRAPVVCDDTYPCQRTYRTHRNRPCAVRAEYEADETPGVAGKRGASGTA